MPPLFTGAPLAALTPPHTIIFVPVQTAVCSERRSGSPVDDMVRHGPLLGGMSVVVRSGGELAAPSADARSRPAPPSLPGRCTLPTDASGADGARTPPHPTTS